MGLLSESRLKSITVLVASLLGISLVLAGTVLAFASSTPNYYGGPGGTISGIVVSPTGNVVDWSQIYAKSGNETYGAFSGFSGFYLMRVPAGTYNVTVYDFYDPTYWAPTANVTVTDGSNTTVNFYLEFPTSPVPEFQSDLLVVAIMLAMAAACILTNRSRRLSIFH